MILYCHAVIETGEEAQVDEVTGDCSLCVGVCGSVCIKMGRCINLAQTLPTYVHFSLAGGMDLFTTPVITGHVVGMQRTRGSAVERSLVACLVASCRIRHGGALLLTGWKVLSFIIPRGISGYLVFMRCAASLRSTDGEKTYSGGPLYCASLFATHIVINPILRIM